MKTPKINNPKKRTQTLTMKPRIEILENDGEKIKARFNYPDGSNEIVRISAGYPIITDHDLDLVLRSKYEAHERQKVKPHLTVPRNLNWTDEETEEET